MLRYTQLGVHAAALEADLLSEEDTQRLIARANAAVGPLTALVNNASVFENDVLATMTRLSWDSHIETNLRAPLVLSQNFAEQLPSHAGGAIINLLDQRLFKPTPQFLSYGVSKAGLHWLTRVLAQALAPRIRVNAVAPGPTLRNVRQSEAHFKGSRHRQFSGTAPHRKRLPQRSYICWKPRRSRDKPLRSMVASICVWQTADITGVIE